MCVCVCVTLYVPETLMYRANTPKAVRCAAPSNTISLQDTSEHPHTSLIPISFPYSQCLASAGQRSQTAR